MIVAILLCVAGLIVGGVVAGLVAFKAGIAHRKKEAEVAISSAEAEAERIRKDAELQAHHGVRGAESLIDVLLKPGQFLDLLMAIQDINGFSDDINEQKEEAKN